MAVLSPAYLIESWSLDRRVPDHRRLAALLEGAAGPEVRDESLGVRNRRLLELHRDLVGGEIEARVTCAHCQTQNEFEVPSEAILAAPCPGPDGRVRLREGGRRFDFRLPRLSDLESVAQLGEAIPAALFKLCCLNGEPPAELAERLGRKFEALDPAANIVVAITCAGCERPIAATVDLAIFVARGLDRLVDGLMRDVDVIAAAYGWTEETIFALPPARRARYVAMIASARRPSQPKLAGQLS